MDFTINIIFYIALFCLIIIFSTLDLNVDFDFWARLIVGKTFFQTGSLLNNDFYSFGPTKEFIDHEWGSSLIFYLIQKNFSEIGIFLFKILIIFFTFFIITKIIKLENEKAKFHILFFFFVIQSVCYNIFSTIRCQTFSFFFFVLYLYILKFAKTKNNYRVLWTIPFLNIVWQNMHGGFVLGLVLVLLFGIGEKLNKKPSKPYFLTFLATLPTLFINPYGFKYITYIFDAFMLKRTYITEWQSAFFGENEYGNILIKFKVLFFIALILFLYSIVSQIKKRGFKKFYLEIDKSKYLLILFVSLISLKSLRCHVFFSYTVLAFCYLDFYNIFNKKLPKILDNLKEIILCFLLVVSAFSHVYNNGFETKISKKEYPTKCVEFIQKNNLKGNVFTIFHTGSYVAYKLYPKNLVFMDGRYEEVYKEGLIDEMAAFHLAKSKEDKNYKYFTEKYYIDLYIIDKFYPVYNALKKDSNFILAFEEEQFALFLNKKSTSNIKKSYIQPSKDEKTTNSEKFKTNVNF